MMEAVAGEVRRWAGLCPITSSRRHFNVKAHLVSLEQRPFTRGLAYQSQDTFWLSPL
jgi:hypothetical protein